MDLLTAQVRQTGLKTVQLATRVGEVKFRRRALGHTQDSQLDTVPGNIKALSGDLGLSLYIAQGDIVLRSFRHKRNLCIALHLLDGLHRSCRSLDLTAHMPPQINLP
ncbi:hypothetical protein QE368_002120 [Asaia bogorensis NBRC 16594]|nr:hypothetical protein [Asaia bogorensis NBRC 16594]